MKNYKVIICFVLVLALLNIAFAHEDEFGESDSFHFLHRGKLTFPVWTYWAEIIEHFAIVIAVLTGLSIIHLKYLRSLKSSTEKGFIKSISLVEYGLIIIVVSETFTLLHHFLIFPLGVFNAVFHHGLLFIGILLLVIGFVKLAEDKKK